MWSAVGGLCARRGGCSLGKSRCSMGIRTIARVANFLISLIALGARSLKVAPCSCCGGYCQRYLDENTPMAQPKPPQNENRPAAGPDSGAEVIDVLSCGGGWCTRGRQHRR